MTNYAILPYDDILNANVLSDFERKTRFSNSFITEKQWTKSDRKACYCSSLGPFFSLLLPSTTNEEDKDVVRL